MYKVINKTPHFQPYDICMVKGTRHIVIITEVNLNTSQTEDRHQWSYSIAPVNPESKIKSAWYKSDELIYLNNIFEIIAEQSKRNFSTSSYKYKHIRR